jgi:glycosyltransferase involved in cell wall biosynthesis
MKQPLVTVLMSVYNGERYLPDSIKSILNQTFNDFEFIIINEQALTVHVYYYFL